jgi:hypothetical protein
MRSLTRAALLAALWLGAASAAPAQDTGLRGPWMIAKAELAPWADPLQKGGAQEARSLVGRTVIFGPRSVSGPQPLNCPRAHFSTHDDTADLLFEGELAEPDRYGKTPDPVALARAIGMTTRTIRTIESGCSEVAYHRLSPDTLVFGLNNRIYYLHPKTGR